MRAGILVLNIMSSPGAGKTSLLERTAELLAERWRIGVIEGDIQTSNDAERVQKKGIKAVQINTDGACHLDAGMVRAALAAFDLKNLDILIIENVGNLVCPADSTWGTSQAGGAERGRRRRQAGQIPPDVQSFETSSHQ